MRKFSSAGAKNQFGVLIDAARIAPVAVTKYDKPFVVVMAVEEYERLMAALSAACDVSTMKAKTNSADRTKGKR